MHSKGGAGSRLRSEGEVHRDRQRGAILGRGKQDRILFVHMIEQHCRGMAAGHARQATAQDQGAQDCLEFHGEFLRRGMFSDMRRKSTHFYAK